MVYTGSGHKLREKKNHRKSAKKNEISYRVYINLV